MRLRRTHRRRRAWGRALLLACCAICVWVTLAATTPGAQEENKTLKIGYADVDITPQLGVTMPGYFRERRASGVLDPLRCKALVLTQGDVTLAIVALDLIGIKASLVAEIRKAVGQATGIPPDYTFVHCTHTHTGATPSAIREKLPGQVAEAVRKAKGRRVGEERVTLGSRRQRNVAFIRRYLMKDGTVRTNPGRGNRGIIRPIGDIDPNVNVITFTAAKTLLVSFGLHPDCVGGTQFSADYPHHLTAAVRESLGADWNVVYLNACCGNVNHVNVKDKDQLKGYEESRRIGRTLGAAALAAHKDAAPIEIDHLAVRTETVQCPTRKVPKERYDWAKRQMKEDAEKASKRNFNEPTPSRIIALAETQETAHPAEIIAVRLGPVGIVGLPAEVFVENGRDIRAHSLFEPTLVIELVGGSMGYVPHPRGYDEGGYEATFASARHAPETPVLWSRTATRLLKEMKD